MLLCDFFFTIFEVEPSAQVSGTVTYRTEIPFICTLLDDCPET